MPPSNGVGQLQQGRVSSWRISLLERKITNISKQAADFIKLTSATVTIIVVCKKVNKKVLAIISLKLEHTYSLVRNKNRSQ